MAEYLGPFTFADKQVDDKATDCENDICLLCDKIYKLQEQDSFDEFLKHLLVTHKLVVADIKLIADIRRYDFMYSTVGMLISLTQ